MPVAMVAVNGLCCSTQAIYITNIVFDIIDVSLALVDDSKLS